MTGESATGKSSLLDILEYCLGHDGISLPMGPLTTAVSWYAALFQLDGSRAFVARPVPGRKRASRNQAMLRFSQDQELLDHHELRAELDAEALREQQGRRIGIRENNATGHLAGADIRHAALLCFQGQSEIANKNLLFHRQGERATPAILRTTLPYLIGALPPAQTQAQAHAMHREAEEAHEAYADAVRAESATRRALAPLWEQARRLGMLTHAAPNDQSQVIEALRQATNTDRGLDLADDPAGPPLSDLRRQSTQLRHELRALATDGSTCRP
ncbi:hypothetical protein [Kitasatospora sp. NPDC059327]|uniref:hypothetical protein n=1 Tax=Kitasatospora sp. NPDC059327 TaxID=3346803 RepID=UPI0036D17457